MLWIVICAGAAFPILSAPRKQDVVRERLLAILAHPDDEGLLAPLLAKRCLKSDSTCVLLTLSRGENAPCKLLEGCGDLGARRAAELLRVASALHVQVIQWTFADVFTPEAKWPVDAVYRIAQVIRRVQPTIIYTFDPNHGSSCHQAHRYTGLLALAAAEGKRVELIETRIVWTPEISFAAATPDAISFDARDGWRWTVFDVETHESQFTPAEVAGIRNRPLNERRVWLLDAQRMATVTYSFSCP